MKNRKKILIFVLLLCTFFSTLFTITPNVMAVPTTTPPTNLTGYTITVPSGWIATAGYGKFNIYGRAGFNSLQLDMEGFGIGIGKSWGDYDGVCSFTTDISMPNSTNTFARTNSDSLIINVIGGIDVTNISLIQWLVDNNATFDNGEEEPTPSGYDVTLNPTDTSLDFDLFAVGEVLYQINESGYNVPIYTTETPLPYTIEGVENIKFINNSTDYRLLVYQNSQTYSVIEPGSQSLLYSITSDKIIDLELVSIEPELTTYTISGGYMFNPTISSSIFGDYTEQLIDIRLSNNFYLYDLRLLPFNQFSIYSDSENPNILYFTYVYVPEERTTYAGTFTNNGNIITNVAQRTIYFEEQEVSEDVYNWLTNNGRFGNFDNTLPEPSPDNPFGFVVDMVNDFLQIEFLPGLRFIHLLYIGVSIPLCIFILKLFLGG